jgi:hypothetical protein
LKEIINQEIKLNTEDFNKFNLDFFNNKVQIFSRINFNDPFFDVQTKVRKRIKDIVYFKLGYIDQKELLERGKEKYEQKEYLRLLNVQEL